MIGRLIIFFASTNLLTALSQLAMLVMVRSHGFLRDIHRVDFPQYLVFPKRVYVLPMSFVVNRSMSPFLLLVIFHTHLYVQCIPIRCLPRSTCARTFAKTIVPPLSPSFQPTLVCQTCQVERFGSGSCSILRHTSTRTSGRRASRGTPGLCSHVSFTAVRCKSTIVYSDSQHVPYCIEYANGI
jgi:hypothetical protein